MTLYAQWDDGIVFESNNSKAGSVSLEKAKLSDLGDKTSVDSTASANDGYHFVNWTDADGKVVSTDSTLSVVKSGSTWQTGPYTANFEANSYTVVFDANGGEGEVRDEEFRYGQSKCLHKNKFTKDTLVFTGWATSPDGSGNTFTDEKSVKNLTKADGDKITLYAQWAAKIKIVYDHEQCNMWFDSRDRMSGIDGEDEQLIPENKEYPDYDAQTYPLTGYQFVRWEDVDHNIVENTGGYRLTLTKPADGWKSMTYYAIYEPLVTTVSYNGNGGSGQMASQDMLYGEAYTLIENSFTNGDKKFLGWSTKEDGSGRCYLDGAAVYNIAGGASSLTLYAVWEAENQIRFVSNDPKMGSADAGVIEFKTSTDQWVVAAAANEGYHFVNWTDEEGNEIALATYVDDKSSHCIGIPEGGWKAGAVYTANFAANTYTVEFDANGGTGTMADQTFNYGQAQALSPNAFQREGYVFDGWTSDRPIETYQDGEVVKNLNSNDNRTIRMVANWKLDKDAVKVTAKDSYYNRSEHDLLEASIPEGARIRYTLDEGETWQDTVPKASNVGSYTVGYRVYDKRGRYVEGSVTAKIEKQVTPVKPTKITIKGTSISKLTRAKKAFTVKWKKQTAKTKGAHVGGYQVQYARNSKFTKSKKTVTVKKYTSYKKTVKKLKSKKYYYVRVRTYQKISGKTYYSSWSKVKKIKTR